MTQKWLVALAALIVLAGGLWWYLSRTSGAPAPVTENTDQSNATTTASVTPYTFSLVKGDTIKSWDFTGAYSGNTDLTKKAQTEIARLQQLLNSKPTYELYISVAGQYDLLGNGKQELVYLEKALAIDSTHTGLALANVGQLMTKLGAYKTARRAYEQAVAAEPTRQYHQALLYFLETYYPNDTAAIQAEKKAILAAHN